MNSNPGATVCFFKCNISFEFNINIVLFALLNIACYRICSVSNADSTLLTVFAADCIDKAWLHLQWVLVYVFTVPTAVLTDLADVYSAY